MKRVFLFLLPAIIAVNCTRSEPDLDLAGKLVGDYLTTQIDLNRQGISYEAGLFSASNGQITITSVSSSLNQIQLTFSYTLSREGTSLTNRITDTESIQLQAVGDQIYFKGVSSTNLGNYLGFWSIQNSKVTGRYLDKSFTAVKQ